MSESERPSAEQMARMVQQHLASLQSEGIEWLPVSKEPLRPAAPAVEAAAASPVPAVAPAANLLFPEASDNVALTPEQRRVELTLLAQRVAGCTRCEQLARTRTQTVFGVGPVDAELCFLGEAP